MPGTQWEIGWLKFKKVLLPDFVFSVLIQQSIPQLRKKPHPGMVSV
jgi:hypothetical protein